MNGNKAGSARNYRDIVRITLAGAVVNIILSALKAWAGIVAGSRALLADAVHSLSDLSTDFAVILGGKYWTAPADADHPYGHSRIETLVTGFIALVLIATGIGIGWDAVSSMPDFRETRPGIAAVVTAVISVVSKELLYRWTAHRARQLRSKAVAANAWHHRSDAISSMPVVATVAVSTIAPHWFFLDNVVAVLVAGFIVYSGGKLLLPALFELSDQGMSARECRQIEQSVEQISGVMEVHAVRTRRLGGGIAVDLHLLVDGALTVRQGHDIAEKTEQILLDGPWSIIDVMVHVEPFGDDPV